MTSVNDRMHKTEARLECTARPQLGYDCLHVGGMGACTEIASCCSDIHIYIFT